MERIELLFPKDLCKLAGNSYGVAIYDEFVKGKVDYSKKTTIVFPAQINRIDSSFIQGFFDEILKKIGLKGIEERIEIESSIPDLKRFILDNLY